MNLGKTPLGIAACLVLSRPLAEEPLVFKRELRAHSALQPRAARSDIDGDGTEDFYAFYESGILSLSGRTGAILARHSGGGHLGWSIYSGCGPAG
jgi:hypothetical protein